MTDTLTPDTNEVEKRARQRLREASHIDARNPALLALWLLDIADGYEPTTRELTNRQVLALAASKLLELQRNRETETP